MSRSLTSAVSTSADRVPVAQVLGAGPTGALVALAMADAGWAVQVLDPATHEQLGRRFAYTREIIEEAVHQVLEVQAAGEGRRLHRAARQSV